MAEAANLSVSITGDASGLINALATAQNALATLNSSAGKIMSEFDGKNAKINITAVDNTASGVSSARASINSLKDRTGNVSVNYNVQGMPKLADGTQYAKSGLAVVNDERGVSDPRELIEHNGRLMMFSGRDVVVPLSQGDKVYTADETKAIMNGMGIPHYASGKNNEMFEIKNALAQTIDGYSHGMKQKLAIVSALIHNPKLIIMDEPFVGLDPKSSHLLKTLMREMCDNGGAIFFSTHVLEVAEKLCDKVAIIKSGKLIKSGTMDEVKGDDSLEDVFLELEEKDA